MSVRFVDNLLFQKREFPDIYKSYYAMSNNNAHARIFCKKDSQYLYVLVGEEVNIPELIFDLFYMHVDYDIPYGTYILKYDVDDRVSEVEQIGIINIYINHPYLKRYSSILISKVLEERFLEKTSVFYTYNCKPLKQLQELKIRNYCDYTFEANNVETLDQLKKCIRKFEPKYTLNFSFVSNKKNQYFEGVKITEKVSLEVIKIINDKWDEINDKVFQQCIDKTISIYDMRSKEILNNYLQMGCFESNFICIEKYFLLIEKETKNVNAYFDKNIVPFVKRMKKEIMEHVIVHNSLSCDRGILGLDDYIEEELERLTKVLEGK